VSVFRNQLAGKIPVTIVTGFLGSGKTTLISKLLPHPQMNKVAVVINEVGEIGIDHDLVAMSSENISLLANGCICCSVRTDIQETLRDLFARRQVGEVFDFDRVIIETTGLANPAPLLQTLTSDTLLEARFRLDGVVTLVDAVNGYHQLSEIPEALQQIALADQILLTKTDIAETSLTLDLVQELRAINPDAGLTKVINGQIEPDQLINLGLGSAKIDLQSLNFLNSILDQSPNHDVGGEGRYLGSLMKKHPNIKTASISFKEPFTWPAFSSALDLLISLRGPDLLRVKGIVNVEGRPTVIQGVQHIFHNPVTLEKWPSDNFDSRIVFITRNISAKAISNLFSTVREIQ
jgi:G3E family GTPase